MSFLALNIQNGVKCKNFKDFNFQIFFTVLEYFQISKLEKENIFYKKLASYKNKISWPFTQLGGELRK